MDNNGRKQQGSVRWGRVFAAMLIIVVVLFGADGIRRNLSGTIPHNIKVSGSFRNSGGKSADSSAGSAVTLGNETVQVTTAFEGIEYLGFSELALSESKLNDGVLALYTQEVPAKAADKEAMVNLYDYRNEYYTLVSETVMLNEDAAEALNRMMEDYNNATGLSDFIAYGTTDTYTGEGSYCPEEFPDSPSGNTVDLALNGYASVLTYDGYDEESWIVENCWKYGFIVRYPEGKSDKTGHSFCPWHLRYVGKVHAALMNSKDLCLEEYVEYLKDYTLDEPCSFDFDGVTYEIYTVVSQGEVTAVRVPVSGNYTVSGDNSDRFIITTVK